MKKFISVLLCLVLIFSFAMPSFAYPQSDTEMEALNEIEYWTYWIHQDFSEKLEDLKSWDYQSMLQLLDINDFTRSIFSKLDSINNSFFGNLTYGEPLAVTITNSLSSLEDSFNFFNDSFFDNVLWGEPFAEVVQDNLTAMAADLEHTYQLQQYLISDRWDFIEGTWWKSMYDDLHQLKEVLASDEDLALRDSQNNNFLTAGSLFFSGGSSDSSLGAADLGALKGLSNSMFSAFSSTPNYNVTSEFNQTVFYLNEIMNGGSFWFSEATYNSLVTVPTLYSSDSSNEVVTHYYQDSKDYLSSLLGGD